MYIKVCKGDAISLSFQIIEYKIPEFEISAKENATTIDNLISQITEMGYPFKIIGISNKEKDFLIQTFHYYFTETEASYNILRKCLNMAWNEWCTTTEGDNVVTLKEYMEYKELMLNWAKECIEFIKEQTAFYGKEV